MTTLINSIANMIPHPPALNAITISQPTPQIAVEISNNPVSAGFTIANDSDIDKAMNILTQFTKSSNNLESFKLRLDSRDEKEMRAFVERELVEASKYINEVFDTRVAKAAFKLKEALAAGDVPQFSEGEFLKTKTPINSLIVAVTLSKRLSEMSAFEVITWAKNNKELTDSKKIKSLDDQIVSLTSSNVALSKAVEKANIDIKTCTDDSVKLNTAMADLKMAKASCDAAVTKCGDESSVMKIELSNLNDSVTAGIKSLRSCEDNSQKLQDAYNTLDSAKKTCDSATEKCQSDLKTYEAFTDDKIKKMVDIKKAIAGAVILAVIGYFVGSKFSKSK
jgi:hypothetical protein